jgi:cell division protein FtsB
MKLKTKKLIAKEFLFLFLVVILGVISFLCVYPYNLYRINQIKETDNILKKVQKSFDSLNVKLDSVNARIDILNAVSDTTQDGLPILKKKNMWTPPATDPIVVDDNALPPPPPKRDPLGILIPHDQKLTNTNSIQHLDEYGIPIRIKKKPVDAQIKGKRKDPLGLEAQFKFKLDLTKQIEKIKRNLETFNASKKQVEAEMFSFEEQSKFGFLSFVFFLFIFFGGRYLFYAIKWSLDTLKQ